MPKLVLKSQNSPARSGFFPRKGQQPKLLDKDTKARLAAAKATNPTPASR